MKETTLLLMLSCLLVVTASGAHEHESCSDVRTISVSGRAEVEFPPDFIVVKVGASLKNDDPIVLQDALRTASAAMLKFVKGLGVDEKDVSTDRFSVWEVDWDYDEDDCPKMPELPKYEGETSIHVVLRDFDSFDRLVRGLFENGANRLMSVSFDSTLRAEKTREARIAAVRAAKEKAAYIAEELGQRLGHPVEVSDTSRSASARSYSSNSYIVSGLDTMASTATSISASDLTASAQVSIVFALEERTD